MYLNSKKWYIKTKREHECRTFQLDFGHNQQHMKINTKILINRTEKPTKCHNIKESRWTDRLWSACYTNKNGEEIRYQKRSKERREGIERVRLCPSKSNAIKPLANKIKAVKISEQCARDVRKSCKKKKDKAEKSWKNSLICNANEINETCTNKQKHNKKNRFVSWEQK